jgi:hypothetical protein
MEIMQIGSLLYGGIVFYIDVSGEHGFVASDMNQSYSVIWGCQETFIGAIGTNGKENTDTIISQCTIETIAARLCINYRGGGFENWILPSKDELILMYQNIPNFLTPNYYWSSSEFNNKFAWMLHFQTGTLCRIYKNIKAHVRAIRSF